MKKPPVRRYWRDSSFAGVLLALCLVVCGSLSFAFHFNIVGLFAAAASSMNGSSALIFFTPYDSKESLSVGDTATIDLNINAFVPVNAIGATVTFPQDKLEIVGISKERSFLTLWTQDTVIKEDAGELQFSGGTTRSGGMLGTSTVLTITVRAKAPGDATLSVENVQLFAADGKGTSLTSDTRSLTLSIAQQQSATAPAPPASSGTSVAAQPKAPSADLNGDGKIDVVDVSILVFKIFMPYDPRYDLDMDGKVGLSDLSVLFAKMAAQ